MHALILGYGIQGKSSLEHWQKKGYKVSVADKNPDLIVPRGVATKLGDDYLANLQDYDVIVRSPGIHPRDIAAANPHHPEILDKVTGNTNEFFEQCKSKNIIGVTGTKGKGTTSTLIWNMLKESGRTAHLLGNIGTAPLDGLAQVKEDDWVVLELANFQTIDLKYSPTIAVCVMVEPEHQDWHGSLDEYISAKQQLFIHQTSKDIAVYYGANTNSTEIASASPGKKVPYLEKPGAYIEQGIIKIDGQIVCATDEISLLGKHNWQNICAAATVMWQIEQDIKPIKKVATTIGSLPFRTEKRAEINGVTYFNDSFSAAPGACEAAIAAITQPKILIMGGHDRMLDLTNLCNTIKQNEENIRHIIAVGRSKERLTDCLIKAGYSKVTVSDSVDMDEIVKLATSHAKSGDAVVLSPGFASFGMFRNFEVRGNAFNKSVEKLQ